jgi:hypothetical protein
MWKVGAFSPKAFIVRAVVFAALYGISRMAGLQEYTTFLSGTSLEPAFTRNQESDCF